MLFSEREKITTKDFLKYYEIDDALSNRMFNLSSTNIIQKFIKYDDPDLVKRLIEEFQEFIIDRFFKDTIYNVKKNDDYENHNLNTLEYTTIDIEKYIDDNYKQLKWYEKYDLMESTMKFFKDLYEKHILENDNILSDFVKDLNDILEEEKTYYRVIDYKITSITDKLELETVNDALNNGDKFKTASSHIEKALEYFSKKPKGYYNEVIKCSVLALEVALKESLDIKGNDKISNKILINKFQEKYKVNKFVTEPINQFIGILRNGEYDILHSSVDDNKKAVFKATFKDAKYILVMSCNFLNYIKSLKN